MADFGWERGEASLQADVRPACWEMARLNDPYRRTCFVKVGPRTCLHMRDGMCSFFQQMAALRRLEGKDRRQSGRRGDKLWGFFPLFSHLYDFCFLFTPNHCLGTETWQNLFLFVSRQWFDIVSASALEPCWPRVPLLLNVQWFKKKIIPLVFIIALRNSFFNS